MPHTEARQHLALLVLHTRDIGEQDQLLCTQHAGNFASHGIGIDVVAGAVFTRADRSNDGDEVTVLHDFEHLGVNTLHFAHLTDIYDICLGS